MDLELIDFASLTRAVESAGYSGDVECEIFNRAIWDSAYDEVAVRSRDAYEELVAPFLS